MINPQLHRQPVALDRTDHRDLKLDLPVSDWSFAAGLNAVFLPVAEFADACREYAVVFVHAGKEADGTPQIAPIAVLGLEQGQNLYVQDGKWRSDYLPVILRSYPFCIGRLNEERFAICVDMAWPGVGKDQGQPLFQADGQYTELMTNAQSHLETLEGEIQRTRAACQQLWALGALKDMRFDATMPDGSKHSVDGFLTVDVEVMQKLPDAKVGELHRSGLLGLVQLHWASMAGMRRLVEWHAMRAPATAAAKA
jgi:hypothetical protein